MKQQYTTLSKNQLIAAPTVLIIEDEPAMADILAENLSEEGYDVEVAPDGNAGLQTWRTLQPNLVVLDVMLPYKSGYEVCKTYARRR